MVKRGEEWREAGIVPGAPSREKAIEKRHPFAQVGEPVQDAQRLKRRSKPAPERPEDPQLEESGIRPTRRSWSAPMPAASISASKRAR
ncbi:hypothetical protein RTBOTA2_006313 [Rhodotorula toruloides]|nr:hypothetical protein RTBOTA2_006313 [Rhodotorula toruloides]